MATSGKASLRPLPIRVKPVRRLLQLYLGLIGYALSMALMIESGLGNQPWDVLHQGLAKRTGLSIGTIIVIVGVVVLALWLPLRQWPGLGTISNVFVIGVGTDVILAALPTPGALALRISYLVGAVLLCGVASGLYIGAQFGAGPRDGLMTGLVARGYSIRLVRTGIEVTVVAVGFLLGGTVGIGTLVYAVCIGPLVHLLLPLFTVHKAQSTVEAPAPVAV